MARGTSFETVCDAGPRADRMRRDAKEYETDAPTTAEEKGLSREREMRRAFSGGRASFSRESGPTPRPSSFSLKGEAEDFRLGLSRRSMLHKKTGYCDGDAKGDSDDLLRTSQDQLIEELLVDSESRCAVLLSATKPDQTIVAATKAWCELCGYEPEEVIGQSLKLLQGDLTDKREARRFSDCAQRLKRAQTTLVNYHKSGRAFVHRMNTYEIGHDASGERYFVTESYEDTKSSVEDFAPRYARAEAK